MIITKGDNMRNIADIQKDISNHKKIRYDGSMTPQEWWDIDADLSTELWDAKFYLGMKLVPPSSK
tara:strand:+ start:4819 stop:5013 length:195 start_codon:yes stop_codon:yes gene_type:complete